MFLYHLSPPTRFAKFNSIDTISLYWMFALWKWAILTKRCMSSFVYENDCGRNDVQKKYKQTMTLRGDFLKWFHQNIEKITETKINEIYGVQVFVQASYVLNKIHKLPKLLADTNRIFCTKTGTLSWSVRNLDKSFNKKWDELPDLPIIFTINKTILRDFDWI